MVASFAVLVAALGAVPVHYEVSLRTEGRTGSSAVSTSSTSSFLELDPGAGLSSRFGALGVEGAYRPRLLYSLNIDHSFAVLHRANVGGNWALSKRTRLTFDESLSWGRNDYSPLLAVTGTTVPEPRLPTVLVLAYFGSTSSVGIAHSTLRGLEVGGFASYSLSGGLDQPARSVLPLSRTGTGSGRVSYLITRSDAVTSSVSASVSTFSNGGETLAGNGAVGWRHQFDRATQGDVSAGISVTKSARSGLPDAIATGPSASLGVSHQASVKRPQQLRGEARVSYGAAIDPYGAGAYHSLSGSLGADYSPLGWLGFNLRGSAARGFSGQPELRNGIAQLEFSTRFNVDPHLSIGSGVRTAWLYSFSGVALPGFQWAAFLGLTVLQGGNL